MAAQGQQATSIDISKAKLGGISAILALYHLDNVKLICADFNGANNINTVPYDCIFSTVT